MHAEIRAIERELKDNKALIVESMGILKDVALKPQGSDALEYIDMRIELEKQNQAQGWRENLETLEEQKQHEKAKERIWEEHK